MGILSGSIAVTRYRVLGLSGPINPKDVNAQFRVHQMPKNWRKGKQPEVFGWVPPVSEGGEEVDYDSPYWDLSQCNVENGWMLRVRIDKRAVPAEVLRLTLRDKIKDFTDQYEKPPGRKKKKELKDEAIEQLMESALPAISYVDGFFDDQAGQVLVFSSSKSASEKFELLFRKSFCEPLGARLIRFAPPLSAIPDENWAESNLEMSLFSGIANTTPMLFTEGRHPDLA